MTVRAIAGLAVYNAFLLGVGAGVLWGVRGWRWWTELVRLAGVAYLLGIASLMTLLTLELVLGIPVSAAAIVVSGIALVVLGLVVGWLRGHVAPGLRPPGWRVPGLTLFGALFAAGIVVYLEALFRADRLSGITREWDSWAFWMPRAEGLYFFERLDPDFLLQLPQRPSYPPGISAIQTAAFHAMGSADTVSLHVQYWFFAAAFCWAVIGLLSPRVHQAILLPVLLAFLVSPTLMDWITTVYADIPLGYLVAIAALLMLLWVDERQAWMLTAATLLLAGAMLTKREGLLFAACIFLAAFVASAWDRKGGWRSLIVAGIAAVALALPWRIWFTAHGLEGDGPDAGYLGVLNHLDRLWPSFELVASTVVDRDLWRIASFLGVAAIVLVLIAGAWRISAYTISLVALLVAGATWVMWSNTSLLLIQEDSANPIVRMTGTTVLVLAALTPFLLQRAWSQLHTEQARAPSASEPIRDALVWSSPWLWAVVAIGVLSHPGAMLAGYSGSGLPGGAPVFPAASDCVSDPLPNGRIRVVVGYADSYPEAETMRARARAAGLAETEVAKDGCGRLRVFVDGVPPVSLPQAVADLGRGGSLQPTLELDPGG